MDPETRRVVLLHQCEQYSLDVTSFSRNVIYLQFDTKFTVYRGNPGKTEYSGNMGNPKNSAATKRIFASN